MSARLDVVEGVRGGGDLLADRGLVGVDAVEGLGGRAQRGVASLVGTQVREQLPLAVDRALERSLTLAAEMRLESGSARATGTLSLGTMSRLKTNSRATRTRSARFAGTLLRITFASLAG